MKIAVLPNGTKLQFPKTTSDKVVQATVKRILNVKDGPTVEENIQSLLNTISKNDEKKVIALSKEQKDFIGPAIDKQLQHYKRSDDQKLKLLGAVSKDTVTAISTSSKTVSGSIDKIVKQLSSLENKDLNKTLNDVTKSLAAVLGQQIENLVKELKKNNQAIKTMDKNIVSSNNELAAAFRVNTQTLSELVAKTGQPREVIYTKDNKIKGIK